MATAIEVENLTKWFVAKKAVNEVSFTIDQGEIVGFLGPNGAGKSTTLRMLTCFLPATNGRASVFGYDIFDQSIEVRKKIGYLPESTPLYPEMRVEEYLRFRARLKGVGRSQIKKAVGDAMDRTHIADVKTRIIGQLSKGYRQRVGLADALVASPPMLILDEPTIGLDPNQIRQTRSLIKELGEDHTVFLSTHILPEVEQICDRVLIINRGKIVGQGSPKELREKVSQGVRLRILAVGQDPQGIKEDLEDVQGVTMVTDQGNKDGSYCLSVLADNDPKVRDRIFYAAVDGDWVLRELATESMSLEEVFAQITGEEELDEEDDEDELDEDEDEIDEDEDELDDQAELDEDEPDEDGLDEEDEPDEEDDNGEKERR